MTFSRMIKIVSLCVICISALPASAQMMTAQAVLEDAAEAMGGLSRIRNIDSLLMKGFSQTLNQDGGSAPSSHPKAPKKWAAQNGVERYFDLDDLRAYMTDQLHADRLRQIHVFPHLIVHSRLALQGMLGKQI